LNLNQEQANHIYEINLRYARERQISNKRSEALERMKNKNAEIKQILSPEQNDRLLSKRYERTYLETNTLNRNQSKNSSGFRPTSNLRTNQTNRIPSSPEMNIRNNFRPVNPNFIHVQFLIKIREEQQQTFPQANQSQRNSSSPRSTSGATPGASRRSESVMPQHNNSSKYTNSNPDIQSIQACNTSQSNRKVIYG